MAEDYNKTASVWIGGLDHFLISDKTLGIRGSINYQVTGLRLLSVAYSRLRFGSLPVTFIFFASSLKIFISSSHVFLIFHTK